MKYVLPQITTNNHSYSMLGRLNQLLIKANDADREKYLNLLKSAVGTAAFNKLKIVDKLVYVPTKKGMDTLFSSNFDDRKISWVTPLTVKIVKELEEYAAKANFKRVTLIIGFWQILAPNVSDRIYQAFKL